MKRIKKLSWLVTIVLFCGINSSAYSQTLKDVFSNSESPIFYLGIDFSKTKLLDTGNPDDIRNYLYASINQLIVNEPKKYDLKGTFHKGTISPGSIFIRSLSGTAGSDYLKGILG